MKINEVKVSYSELRSQNFTNTKYEIGYNAEIYEGESVDDCRRQLLEKAIKEVKLLHGDEIEDVRLQKLVKKVGEFEMPF
jgi:hypothetical protein